MIPDETSTPEESTPPKFRERRSAYSEEPAAGEVPPAAGEPEAERAGPLSEPEPEPAPGAAPGEVDLAQLEELDIPEPSFLEIVQPLEIQALQFLGEVPLTASGERRVLARWAKHVIDLLGILEERTRGHLPEDEREYLETVLAELRTRYLRVAQ